MPGGLDALALGLLVLPFGMDVPKCVTEQNHPILFVCSWWEMATLPGGSSSPLGAERRLKMQ